MAWKSVFGRVSHTLPSPSIPLVRSVSYRRHTHRQRERNNVHFIDRIIFNHQFSESVRGRWMMSSNFHFTLLSQPHKWGCTFVSQPRTKYTRHKVTESTSSHTARHGMATRLSLFISRSNSSRAKKKTTEEKEVKHYRDEQQMSKRETQMIAFN